MKKILVSALATIALAASAANITWGQLGTIEETANVVTDVKIPTVVAGTPAATDLTVTVTPVVDANSTTNSYEIKVAAPAGFDPTQLQAAIDDLCVSTQALQTAVTTLGTDKADKATTLSGYGIADTVITNGVVTIGGDSITPLTSAAVSGIVWDDEIDGEISNLHETIVALKQLIEALGGNPPAAAGN